MENLIVVAIFIFWIISSLQKLLKETEKKKVKVEKKPSQQISIFKELEKIILPQDENFDIEKENTEVFSPENIEEKLENVKEKPEKIDLMEIKEKKLLLTTTSLPIKKTVFTLNLIQLKKTIILSEIIGPPLCKRK